MLHHGGTHQYTMQALMMGKMICIGSCTAVLREDTFMTLGGVGCVSVTDMPRCM